MTIPFTFQRTDRGDTVSVFLDGAIQIATQKHPVWGLIVSELNKDYPSEAVLRDLFATPAEALRENISEYTDRVTIDGDEVLLDGNVITGPLPEKILKVYGSGGSVKGLVRFLENLDDNPSHRSREQLFAYLQRHDFQITEDGNFIAYKGLTTDSTSINSGRAFVDGVEHNGQIPNHVGSFVTMPRSEISDDPNVACHVGLHAGAWSYADMFGRGCVAKVEINPADVVSVPSDSEQRKLRVCCYKVLEVDLVEPNNPEDAVEGQNYADPFDEAAWEVADPGWDEGYREGQADAQSGAYV